MVVARAARFRWADVPISGRMVRSPGRTAPISSVGECADLRENAPHDLRENGAFSGRAGLPGRAPRGSLCVALAASMVGGGAAIACALGRILPRRGVAGKDSSQAGRGWEGFFPGAVTGEMTGKWMCQASESIVFPMWSWMIIRITPNREQR